jgi:integrase
MGKAVTETLNKAKIEELRPKGTMYRVPHGEVHGLNIQMTPAGVLSWVLRFRVNGRRVNHTIGRWPEMTVALAKKKALSLLGEISDGNDPAAKKKAEREAATVAELARRFQKEHLPTLKKSTSTEYERLLKKRILPGLGSMRVKDVQPSDVAALLSKIRADTPTGVMANRARAILSKMFSLAGLWGLRPDQTNPAKGQARAPETKKDRHLSDREIVALGAALRHLDPTTQERGADALPAEDRYALAVFRLALLTGMRKGEMVGDKKRDIPALPWTAVDLEAARIRLEHHKTSKKAGARIVPLCPAACQLLEDIPKMLGNPYVFPGHEKGEAMARLQSSWVRVRASASTLQEKANVPLKDRVNLSDVTIHDLRRSFASLAARMGYPELIVAALLGHSAGSVTAGYARIGAEPLRNVVEAIGERMAALLAGSVDLEAEAKAAKEEAQAKRATKSA